MSKNSKQTSNKVAKLVSEVLRDPSSSAIQKKLAGSALAQTHSPKQTGNEIESEASRVLKSEKYNDTTKTLAASLVSQSNKER